MPMLLSTRHDTDVNETFFFRTFWHDVCINADAEWNTENAHIIALVHQVHKCLLKFARTTWEHKYFLNITFLSNLVKRLSVITIHIPSSKPITPFVSKSCCYINKIKITMVTTMLVMMRVDLYQRLIQYTIWIYDT